jgi:carboxypeptidase C (cathepsin A)
MAFSLTLNPNLKVLIQHGYYDLNTPFYQSELNIKNAGLSAKIPVKSYEGGHGVSSYDTTSYDQVIEELDAFYDQPQAQTIAALNSSGAEKEIP